MNANEMDELIGLYIDNTLPEALRHLVEAHLAEHPETAREVRSLQLTAARLSAVPSPKPDSWFVERALDGLLRENAEAFDLFTLDRQI